MKPTELPFEESALPPSDPTSKAVVTTAVESTRGPLLAASMTPEEQYHALHESVYQQQGSDWKQRWQEVLSRTAPMQLPETLDDVSEDICRIVLMRAYAALTCGVDDAAYSTLVEQLELLTTSTTPHIAAAAHHHLGKLIVLKADLPNMATKDPAEIEANIALRLKGIGHYLAVQMTDVHGEPIQLSGPADLPDSTLDKAYTDRVPAGAELPVNRIVPPKRLTGTGLEAVAVLQMIIGQRTEAMQSAQKALDEIGAHLSMYAAHDKPFNVMNFRLAEFATMGLKVNLESTGHYADREFGQLHSADFMRVRADQILAEMETLGLDDWKKAEWQACVQAGLAMSAEQKQTRDEAVGTMLALLTTYRNTRPEAKGGRAGARKVLGHDAIYALVLKEFGTPEQQAAFSELLA